MEENLTRTYKTVELASPGQALGRVNKQTDRTTSFLKISLAPLSLTRICVS